MQIQPINYTQPKFKAINQKYLKWAEKEAKGIHRFGEIFVQIEGAVFFEQMKPKDAFDTVKAIREIMPIDRHDEADRSLNYIKHYVK